MNTATVHFTTAVRQMTEMFQWPKCLSKRMTDMYQRKKTELHIWSATWKVDIGSKRLRHPDLHKCLVPMAAKVLPNLLLSSFFWATASGVGRSKWSQLPSM